MARAAKRAGGFSAVFDFPLHYAINDVFCDDKPLGRLAATFTADRDDLTGAIERPAFSSSASWPAKLGNGAMTCASAPAAAKSAGSAMSPCPCRTTMAV